MSILCLDSPVPRYARVAQLLRQRIDKGVWKPGDHLPKLEDLMNEFEIARVTARQAIGLLAQDGLVSVGRGRGTVVQFRPTTDQTLQLQTSLSEMANAYRTDTPTLTLIDEKRNALPRLTPNCGTPVEAYRYIKRVHARDGDAYCVIAVYLDEAVFRKAPMRFRREIIIPVLLELSDVTITRAHQTLRISVADVETSKLLDIPVNSAVGEVVRIFHDTDGKVMYVAEIIYRAEFIRFQMELKL